MSSFSEDCSHVLIDNETMTLFQNLHISDTCQNIVITGAVSVGKSTLLNSLYDLLKDKYSVQTFPEFVIDKFGQDILKRMLEDDVSVLTFQSYVLDFWDRKPQFKNINLFERVLDDSVYIFCQYYMEQGKLTELEYNTLSEKMKRINEKWDLPSYMSECEFHQIETHSDINEELRQIYNVLKETRAKTLIFGLCVDPRMVKDRIAIRNRAGESAYSDLYIKRICDLYELLYNDL